MTDDAYAAHLARRRSPAVPDGTAERPPPGFEVAVDPDDVYANGGEQPWDADSPPVRKLRRIGQGRVRVAAHGLGIWNPFTSRFE